jgi:hypothetical protein
VGPLGAATGDGVTEDLRDPNKAVDYIIANSGKFAQAKAQLVYLEEFRKSKKALLMAQSTAKAAVEREQYAYGHEDYLALLGGIKAAIEVEEDLRWKLEAAKIRVEIWRSQEASNRTQDRSTR